MGNYNWVTLTKLMICILKVEKWWTWPVWHPPGREQS